MKERFRLTPHQVEILLQKLGPRLEPKAGTNNALNAKEKLLIALRFYATNDFYYSLADCQGIGYKIKLIFENSLTVLAGSFHGGLGCYSKALFSLLKSFKNAN